MLVFNVIIFNLFIVYGCVFNLGLVEKMVKVIVIELFVFGVN